MKKVFGILILISMSLAKASTLPSAQIKLLCGDTAKLRTCQQVSLQQATGFSAQELSQIYSIIDGSMDIWSDTVLEGEFETQFKDVKMELAESIISDAGALLGYRVRFSVQAWDTSTCRGDNYDSKKPETMLGCTQGRLKQIIYITPDLKDYEVSDEKFENPYFAKN